MFFWFLPISCPRFFLRFIDALVFVNSLGVSSNVLVIFVALQVERHEGTLIYIHYS